MSNVINMDAQSMSPSSLLKAEIEADLRRAVLGSEKLGDQMLAYLIRMALAELNTDEKSTTVAPDNFFYIE